MGASPTPTIYGTSRLVGIELLCLVGTRLWWILFHRRVKVWLDGLFYLMEDRTVATQKF